MIKFYSSSSSISSKKTKKWLLKHELEFTEINISKHIFSKKELIAILSLTEFGTDDIISKNCKIYKKIYSSLSNITINQLLLQINETPSLIKWPLIIDDKRLQVGFNSDDLRKFLPRDFRETERKVLSKK